MRTYGVIVVLGSEPDLVTWEFPAHVYRALDEAVQLWRQGVAPYIAVSGKHSLTVEHRQLRQPFREADKMADYLIGKGVPRDRILRERESIDTIGNFFYLRRYVLRPYDIKTCLLITTDFREARIKFLWQKVMGNAYPLAVRTLVTGNLAIMTHELAVLDRQREWLRSVPDGDEPWFARTLASPTYGKF